MCKDDYVEFCENKGIDELKESMQKEIIENDNLDDSEKKSLQKEVNGVVDQWVMDNYQDGLIDQAELLIEDR